MMFDDVVKEDEWCREKLMWQKRRKGIMFNIPKKSLPYYAPRAAHAEEMAFLPAEASPFSVSSLRICNIKWLAVNVFSAAGSLS
jgi:hypothetical protein